MCKYVANDSWFLHAKQIILVFRLGGCALNVIFSLNKSEGFLVVVINTSTKIMERSAPEIVS